MKLFHTWSFLWDNVYCSHMKAVLFCYTTEIPEFHMLYTDINTPISNTPHFMKQMHSLGVICYMKIH